MPTPSFAETLHQRLLVFDGPMGTELYRHHIFTNRCFDELNLTDPKLIERILTDYRNAGADVLTTNTFGANRPTLEKYGIADKLIDINKAGAEIARRVADNNPAGSRLFVAGSVGPVREKFNELESSVSGKTVPNSSATWGEILEQVDALWAGGADFILFETLPSRSAMERCAAAMTQRPNIPFVLSCAVVRESGDGHTPLSARDESLVRLLAPLPQPNLIAFGMNCGSGPEGLLAAAEDAVKITNLPLIVQPNAGTPKEFEGRHLYYCSPEYAATYAMRLVNLGIAAVGGCCGITPEHIREIAKMVKPLAKAHTAKIVLKETPPEVQEKPETPLAERSRLARKLARRDWITTVELVPPRGYDLKETIEKSRKLHRCGVDAVNLPDGPRASSRISSLVVARQILQEANIEPILHFCCRDRNLIGMQADLLGCAAFGIQNILFITGDPPKLGLYPDATGVFDTDSIGMAAVQHRLNRGVDLGGQPIVPATQAVIGVGLDPTSLDRKREIDRFRKKIDAGAEFAITQPVFDPDALISFLDEIGECPIPVIAGIWPLASYRNAEFMQNEVPGVVVPESAMQRMQAVAKKPKEEQLAVGIDIAREMIAQVRGRVSGVQVSAPFGRIEIALAVLE
ncbi:MAG: bifunctional homocysteine S-methyltransferase/methylenetetrahydrofolate reductase [Planctomycetaceae bacterium]|jgi:homocysteine S-methyltransferase|nr:bifunctional homocysteine S-methyltransferase/methylenetetrahydrofolate reductase [Planctomycetaceae bacterium]